MSETAPVEVKEPEEKAPSVVLAERWKEWFTEYRKFDHVIRLSEIGYVRKVEIRKGRCVLARRLSGLIEEFPRDFNGTLKEIQLAYLQKPLSMFSALSRSSLGAGVQNHETSILAAARVFTVDDVFNHKNIMHEMGFTLIAVLNEEALAKEPPTRKWSIENNISQTIINLAIVAPTNPLLRSHLTSLFGVAPPDDCDTFSKIKDWMEFTFEAPMFGNLSSSHRLQQYRFAPEASLTTRIAQQVANNPRNSHTAFNVPVERTEQHIGSVAYSRKVTAKGLMHISTSYITDMITQHYPFNRLVDELFESIQSRIDEGDVMYSDLPEFVNAVDAPIILEDFRPLETNPGKATTDKESVKTLLIDFLNRYYGKSETKQITQRT